MSHYGNTNVPECVPCVTVLAADTVSPDRAHATHPVHKSRGAALTLPTPQRVGVDGVIGRAAGLRHRCVESGTVKGVIHEGSTP